MLLVSILRRIGMGDGRKMRRLDGGSCSDRDRKLRYGVMNEIE